MSVNPDSKHNPFTSKIMRIKLTFLQEKNNNSDPLKGTCVHQTCLVVNAGLLEMMVPLKEANLTSYHGKEFFI